jgi:hypothetical protein
MPSLPPPLRPESAKLNRRLLRILRTVAILPLFLRAHLVARWLVLCELLSEVLGKTNQSGRGKDLLIARRANGIAPPRTRC